MKFGIMFANTGPFVEGANAIALATTAEECGFESLWTVEHVVVPSGYTSTYPYDASGKMPGGQEDFDIPDPLIWLSYVAAVTKKIRLATGILILPQRNAVVTAKAVATLDKLSAGRVTLGVGVGWLKDGSRPSACPSSDVAREPTITFERCEPYGATTARPTEESSSLSRMSTRARARLRGWCPSSSAATLRGRHGERASWATAFFRSKDRRWSWPSSSG